MNHAVPATRATHRARYLRAVALGSWRLPTFLSRCSIHEHSVPSKARDAEHVGCINVQLFHRSTSHGLLTRIEYLTKFHSYLTNPIIVGLSKVFEACSSFKLQFGLTIQLVPSQNTSRLHYENELVNKAWNFHRELMLQDFLGLSAASILGQKPTFRRLGVSLSSGLMWGGVGIRKVRWYKYRWNYVTPHINPDDGDRAGLRNVGFWPSIDADESPGEF
jgi:hypothetical protein